MKKFLSGPEIEAARACPVMRVRTAEAIYPLNRNKIYKKMREGTLPFVIIDGRPHPTTAGLEALCTPPKVAAE